MTELIEAQTIPGDAIDKEIEDKVEIPKSLSLKKLQRSPVVEPRFSVIFDIDGVIARGADPIPEAVEMIKLLQGTDGKLMVPAAFCTNGCNLAHVKATALSNWLDVKIEPDQMIHAQSPLKVYTMWHHKRVLFVGQGNILEIAAECGFTNACSLQDVKDAYPLLDYIDHRLRKRCSSSGSESEKMPRIEAIVLTGEPINWESYLQILIDLLVTNGQPDHFPDFYPEKHLPILACNTDLVFMAAAEMPRLAHGAFLVCLEHLYEKITGYKIKYEAIIGKPSEITYRYAEHTVENRRKQMGYTNTTLKHLYFIGDNPEVDVVGVNLYNQYVQRYVRLSGGSKTLSPEEVSIVRKQASISASRTFPDCAEFNARICKRITSILVGTGVYKPGQRRVMKERRLNYGHRDFEKVADFSTSDFYFENVLDAVKFIIKTEGFEANKVGSKRG